MVLGLDLLSNSFFHLAHRDLYVAQCGASYGESFSTSLLYQSFADEGQDHADRQQQHQHQAPLDQLDEQISDATQAGEDVIAGTPLSATSTDVIEPTQLTPSSELPISSRSYLDTRITTAEGSHVFESCIPATCLDQLPQDSPWQHSTAGVHCRRAQQHNLVPTPFSHRVHEDDINAQCAPGQQHHESAGDADQESSAPSGDVQQTCDRSTPAPATEVTAVKRSNQQQQQHAFVLQPVCSPRAGTAVVGGDEAKNSSALPSAGMQVKTGQEACHATTGTTKNKSRLSLVPTTGAQQQQHQPVSHFQQQYTSWQQPAENLHKQQQQPVTVMPHRGAPPAGPQAAPSGAWRGTSVAAQARRLQKPFKAPRPASHPAAGAATGSSNIRVAKQQPPAMSGHVRSRPPGTFKPPMLLQADKNDASAGQAVAAPSAEGVGAVAATPAGNGFITCRGGIVRVSAAARARASALLQEELGDWAAPDPTADAGVAGDPALVAHEGAQGAAAAQAAMYLHMGPLEPGTGFITCRGGIIPVSTAARARAAALLADELGTADKHQVAAVHITAAGVPDSPLVHCETASATTNTAAAAAAAPATTQGHLPVHDCHVDTTPGVAAADAVDGFVTGRGMCISVSAAARAKAAMLLQEELQEPSMLQRTIGIATAVAQYPATAHVQHPGNVQCNPGACCPPTAERRQLSLPAGDYSTRGCGHNLASHCTSAREVIDAHHPALKQPHQQAREAAAPAQESSHRALDPRSNPSIMFKQHNWENHLQQHCLQPVVQAQPVVTAPCDAAAAAAAVAAPEAVCGELLFDMSLASEEFACIDRLVAEAEQQMMAARAKAACGSGAASSAGPVSNACESALQAAAAAAEQCAATKPPGAVCEVEMLVVADSQPASDDDPSHLQAAWPHTTQHLALQAHQHQHSTALPAQQQQIQVSRPDAGAAGTSMAYARLAAVGSSCARANHQLQQGAISDLPLSGQGNLVQRPGTLNWQQIAAAVVAAEPARAPRSTLCRRQHAQQDPQPAGSCRVKARCNPKRVWQHRGGGSGSEPAVALRGVQWAGGDGVLVSRSAAEAGEVFAAKLVSLDLLPPAWDQQHLLVELLVDPDGTSGVRLLLGTLKLPPPPPPPPSQRQEHRQQAAAPRRCHQALATSWQHSPQQQLFLHAASSPHQGPLTGTAGSRPQPPASGPGSSRPPKRKHSAGRVDRVPKRGSLQACWGAAALRSGCQQPKGQVLVDHTRCSTQAGERPVTGHTLPPTPPTNTSGPGVCRALPVAATKAPPEPQGRCGQAGHGPQRSKHLGSVPASPGSGAAAGSRWSTSSPAETVHKLQLMGRSMPLGLQQPVVSGAWSPAPLHLIPAGEQQPASACLPTDSPALFTAGGRQVDVSAAAREQFRFVLAGGAQEEQQQQVAGAVERTAGGQQQPTDSTPAMGAQQAAPQPCQSIQYDREQQGAPQRAQPLAQHAAAAGSHTLSTAGGKPIEVNAEAVEEFKRTHLRGFMQGNSSSGQQELDPCEQYQQQQQQGNDRFDTARRCTTSPGKPLDTAPADIWSGLSTAGGRRVGPSAAARQAFGQLVSSIAPQQQHPAHSAALQQQQQQLNVPHVTPQHTPQHMLHPAVTTPCIGQDLRSQAHAWKGPPAAAAAPAAGRPRPSLSPASAGAGFKTPRLPPRLSSRKRSLSHPHTPGLMQQQGASGSGAAGTAARKAFRPPAVIRTPSPHHQAGNSVGDVRHQAAGTALSSSVNASTNKRPRLQAEALGCRGMSLSQYFSLVHQQLQQPSSTASMVAATCSGAARLVWVVDEPPVSPKAAAAFVFRASLITAAKSAVELVVAGKAAAPAPTVAGGVFGAAEAHAALVSSGADGTKATAAWVFNHYRWIVWKLASYDRKLLRVEDGSSCRAVDLGLAGVCLRADQVMQQLHMRYTREVVEGQRSVLKKVLEHDLPAGVPLVLLVSDIRRRQQQLQGQVGEVPSAATAATAAGDSGGEVLGMQLSDGWYSVNTVLDGALTELITRGRLQVGMKVRVVGAELRSERAAEPLEAARTALLKLSFNGVSPAPWDAKLGPVPTGQTLRPLTQVHPSGGLVPRLLLLVERRYPLQFWCRSLKQHITPKILALAQQRAEKQQEQAMHAANSAALQEELQQCKQWAASRSSSPVEKAYAEALLQADGGGAAGADAAGADAGGGVSLEVQAFRAARQSQLEARRQHHLQQMLHTTQAAAAAGVRGSSSTASALQQAADTAAAVVRLNEAPTPVMLLRVKGVVPAGLGPCWGHGEALVKVWRPCEAVQQLDEGVVMLATGLSASTSGRSSTMDGRSKLLELSSCKMTSWHLLGPASSLTSADLDVPAWQPRCTIRLNQLGPHHIGKEVDFSGVLVWAGDVNTYARDWMQWIFLADESTAQASDTSCTPSTTSQVHCTALAVCLAGAPTAVDWFTPSSAAGPSSSRKRVDKHSQQMYVAASNLFVQSYDAVRGLWVAEAHITHAGVQVVSSHDTRVRQTSMWAQQQPDIIEACRGKVLCVIGGT